MHSYKELYERVNSELEVIDFGKIPENLYDPIYYSLKVGGKRIRPILCLMAAELFGSNYDEAINAALGIEIFHNFTLLHDDMMDNADTRRGQPVVHVKWNENIAILSGDAMSVIAYKYIAATNNNLKNVLDAFIEASLQICEGQQYDMDFETEKNISEADYLKMINLKTAVLLAISLKIGAIIANASEQDIENIYKFGQNLGIAFQLQDDMLDVFGNVEKFGKNIGGDIVSNKKTYLLIKAFELAEGELKRELNEWVEKKEFNPEEKIKAVQNIYEKLNVKEYSKNLMESYFQDAYKYFEKVNIDNSKKQKILDFTDTLKSRDF